LPSISGKLWEGGVHTNRVVRNSMAGFLLPLRRSKQNLIIINMLLKMQGTNKITKKLRIPNYILQEKCGKRFQYFFANDALASVVRKVFRDCSRVSRIHSRAGKIY